MYKPPAKSPCVLLLQERVAALESELRKSKRAEQKLQALLFRLRQDVADVQQGADLMQKLQDQRALEYEVDFLTNKIKVTALLGVAAVRCSARMLCARCSRQKLVGS